MDLGSEQFISPPNDSSDGTLFSGTSSDASSATIKLMTLRALPERTSQSTSITPERSKKAEKRGRKGHTKSRSGCLNCKRARIKCKENRPSCDYCAHRNLKCEWPDIHVNQIGTLIRKPTPVVSVPINPQTRDPVYSAQDFRLFYHFIQYAYPHHPLGNDSVWTHEIPAIASKYDFLLNAMLALSAEDMFVLQPSRDKNLHLNALAYRVKSVESLSRAVSAGIESFEIGNAMLATCYCLMFQSVMLNEALVDYFSHIRGCVSVAMQMGMRNMKFIFTKAFGDDQLDMIKDELYAAPLINSEVVAKANRSLEKMEHLCQTKVEISMFRLLLNMARSLITSSGDAYIELRKIYSLFSYDMQHDEFREFTNPVNEVCQLLQAHFVAMQLIMTPITKSEWKDRESAARESDEVGDGSTGRWLKTLHDNMPLHLIEYYEWTLWIDDEVQKGRIYNGVYE
ncbi:uncharacterized protein LY89DRAFT_225053 [Mollisia scopiformis]|uniref:Zn(2)-C6 fungal-type domain-containing protein n=1 Tax=Mollisia scopiformis TaxID=149040 RepID=A0A194WW86_MOLSC|nr:uncharacterized protein LY89DRAFT_225053 [Mollisia scopiformis]KUJ12226.1 hypothetical protein LY89DRAFT_225053 [Mollisia scopiformis]